MTKRHRIALVEDNVALREEIGFLLDDEGFAIHGFGEATPFLVEHRLQSFDAVILDIGLPDRDGFNVAQELMQQQDPVGIIMLTARTSVDDRIQGLSRGADAYLGKPFEFSELLAHLRALLRRLEVYSPQIASELPGNEQWQLDACRYQLKVPNNEALIELTAVECSILQRLAQHHPECASRSELIQSLGEDHRLYDERRLEQIMSRLRKKIREHADTSPIKAVRGRGYRFAEALANIG